MNKTIYCTIAAANYLPRIQVLRDSLRKQGHTDFRVLLIEHPALVKQIQRQLPDYQFYSPDQVGCPQWLQMAFYYNVMEFSTALKPSFIRLFLKEANVVYLDPDIEVFSPLTEIEEQLQTHDLVVTPHISRPIPDDGKIPRLLDIIRLGQFNLGFLGVRSGPEQEKLMDWWQEVLIEGASASPQLGIFTDQSWAAILVSFARRTHILRSARYNLAYWNIGLHSLTWDGVGVPQTEDGPLGFYHYSGLDRDHVTTLSKHQTREKTAPGSPLFLLLTQYLNALDASPLQSFTKKPYSFASYFDGRAIPAEHRALFARLPAVNRKLVVNPFAEPAYFDGLQRRSSPIAFGDYAHQYVVAQQRLRQLEHRINSLPYSLFSNAELVMKKLAPGSWARAYHLMQRTSQVLRPRVAQLRQLLR